METNTTQVKGIMIMKSYYDAMNELETLDQLIIFKAIMEFGFNGTEPEFDKKYLNGYWKLIVPTLSRGISNYISKVNNGKKGGQAKALNMAVASETIPVKASVTTISKNLLIEENKALTPQQTKLIKFINGKELVQEDKTRFIRRVSEGELTSVEEIIKELTYFV